MYIGVIIAVVVITTLICGAGVIAFMIYQRSFREAKNYERGLKMVPMMIHLPPSSDDIEGGGVINET